MSEQIALTLKSMKRFKCIGDQCENTCCAFWKIPIEKEVLENYEKDLPELHSLIASVGGESPMMPLQSNGSCVALDRGMCSIQVRFGETHMTRPCIEYPRQRLNVNEIALAYVSPSCPEAARQMLLEDDGLEIEETTIEDAVDHGSSMQIAQLDAKRISALYAAMIKFLQNDLLSAEHTLLQFLTIMHELEHTPMVEWEQHFNSNSSLAENEERWLPSKVNDIGEASLSIVASVIQSKFLSSYSRIDSLKQSFNEGVDIVGARYGAFTGGQDELDTLVRGNSVSPTDKAKIDNWLKRHLAVSIVSNELPFDTQTEEGKRLGNSVRVWANNIAKDFLIARFCLLSLLKSKNFEALEASEVVDLLHRVYRATRYVFSEEQAKFLNANIEKVASEVMYGADLCD